MVKETMEYQRLEIDKALIERKAKISSYYLSIRDYRETIDIKRAGMLEEKNKKRRLKRAVEKEARLRTNNGFIGSSIPIPPELLDENNVVKICESETDVTSEDEFINILESNDTEL
jgi:hypothetical protein